MIVFPLALSKELVVDVALEAVDDRDEVVLALRPRDLHRAPVGHRAGDVDLNDSIFLYIVAPRFSSIKDLLQYLLVGALGYRGARVPEHRRDELPLCRLLLLQPVPGGLRRHGHLVAQAEGVPVADGGRPRALLATRRGTAAGMVLSLQCRRVQDLL